jgi:hypothetical protein
MGTPSSTPFFSQITQNTDTIQKNQISLKDITLKKILIWLAHNKEVGAEKIWSNLVPSVFALQKEEKEIVFSILAALYIHGSKLAKDPLQKKEVMRLITFLEIFSNQWTQKHNNLIFFQNKSKAKDLYKKAGIEINRIERKLNLLGRNFIRSFTLLYFVTGRVVANCEPIMELLSNSCSPFANFTLSSLSALVTLGASYNMLERQVWEVGQKDLISLANSSWKNARPITWLSNLFSLFYALSFACLPALTAPRVIDAFKLAIGDIKEMQPIEAYYKNMTMQDPGFFLFLFSLITLQRSSADDTAKLLEAFGPYMTNIHYSTLQKKDARIARGFRSFLYNHNNNRNAVIIANQNDVSDIEAIIEDALIYIVYFAKHLLGDVIKFSPKLLIMIAGLIRIATFSNTSRSGGNYFFGEIITDILIGLSVIGGIGTIYKSADKMVTALANLHYTCKRGIRSSATMITNSLQTPSRAYHHHNNNPEAGLAIDAINNRFFTTSIIISLKPSSETILHGIAIAHALVGLVLPISKYNLKTELDWITGTIAIICNFVTGYAIFARNIPLDSKEQRERINNIIEFLAGGNEAREILFLNQREVTFQQFIDLIKREVLNIAPVTLQVAFQAALEIDPAIFSKRNSSTSTISNFLEPIEEQAGSSDSQNSSLSEKSSNQNPGYSLASKTESESHRLLLKHNNSQDSKESLLSCDFKHLEIQLASDVISIQAPTPSPDLASQELLPLLSRPSALPQLPPSIGCKRSNSDSNLSSLLMRHNDTEYTHSPGSIRRATPLQKGSNRSRKD